MERTGNRIPQRPNRPHHCDEDTSEQSLRKLVQIGGRVLDAIEDAESNESVLHALARIEGKLEALELKLDAALEGGMTAAEAEQVNTRLRATLTFLKTVQ